MSDVMWLHCVSPMHNGVGQGIGSVDRPIIREVATKFPYLQSSTIKGALRALAVKQGNPPASVDIAFGGEAVGGGGNQGCVCFDDAQVVLFPVRSMRGTFAWTTSLLALSRLRRTLVYAGISNPLCVALDALFALNINLNDDEILCVQDTVLGMTAPPQVKMCLENRVLQARSVDAQGAAFRAVSLEIARLLYPGTASFQDFMVKRAALLSENTYTEILCRCTIIEANIRILPSGVTDDGSLRYSEYLPSETVLFSLCTVLEPLTGGLSITDIEQMVSGTVCANYITGQTGLGHGVIQFGADETKGKGLTATRLTQSQAPAANIAQLPAAVQEG